jgi:BlaI family transcriptional regulator, penicillinase repressor
LWRARVPLPTPAEFRLLEILWQVREGTIEEVLQASGESPRPNYKTVQTLLRIMEGKKLVSHRVLGRAFVFKPGVERDEINRRSVYSLLKRHFGGSRTELLLNLLDDEKIDPAELDELEELIRRRKARQSGQQESPRKRKH